MQIRYRNIVRSNNNVIISGSASIVENTYLRNENGDRLRNHTKQTVVERLGKVIWMKDDTPQQGIFYSPSRGLVFYDLNLDAFSPVDPKDERLIGSKFQPAAEWVHTNLAIHFSFSLKWRKPR